jgi:hypothetical protein
MKLLNQARWARGEIWAWIEEQRARQQAALQTAP